MKKIILLLAAGLFTQMASAQLYAENDAFIFSKGSDIFVREKVKLETGTAFYLRGEAQLIQKDDVDNEGGGFLSVYQEGTSNEFTYNYWGAPVSDETTGIDGNVGFKRTLIKYPITGGTNDEFSRLAGNSNFLNAPNYDGVSDDGTANRPLDIAGYWLWNFDSSGNATAGYAGWIPFQTDNTVLEPGLGYTMKGTKAGTGNNPNLRTFNGSTGQRYDFRGRPNNGIIDVSVGDDNVTLVGNPYPSALDLKRFLQANAENVSGNDVIIDPEIRYWESVQETSHFLIDYLGGYGVYVPMGFEAGSNDGYANNGDYIAPIFTRIDNDGNILTSQQTSTTRSSVRRYAAVAQGFFICRTRTSVTGDENHFARAATPNLSDGTTVGTDSGTPINGDTASFNNSMRECFKEDGDLSLFKSIDGDLAKSGSTGLSSMLINVVHRGEYARPLKMVFSDNTTQDYDHAWEGKLNNRQGNDSYIDIEGDEYGLSSQAFDINMRIPLGLEVRHPNGASRLVEFEIADFQNFNPSEVFLYDGFTGIYHDIKSRNQFLLVQPGFYKNRFEITFTNTTLSNEGVDLSALEIYQNNKVAQLTVLNPNMMDVKDITLYDLAGRLVIKLDNQTAEANYTIGTQAFSTGIYIAKVTTKDDQVKTQKVSIAN